MRQRTEMALAIATLLAIVAIQFYGCAGWRDTAKTTLSTAIIGTQGTEAVVRAHYQSRCRAVAFNCFIEQDRKCEPLVKCQAERRMVYKVIFRVYAAVAVGYSALALSEQKSVSSAVAEAIKAVAELQSLAKKFGVL